MISFIARVSVAITAVVFILSAYYVVGFTMLGLYAFLLYTEYKEIL